jgi:hypothetical protein
MPGLSVFPVGVAFPHTPPAHTAGHNGEILPMRRRFRPMTFALASALAALQATSVWGQEPAAVDSAAPADTAARKTLGELPVYITGYITTSYTWASNPTGDQITGRFYDRYHDTFVPNALRLGIEKLAATDKVDIGARFELLFGTDAQVTQAFVDGGTFNLGDYGDLTEAYVTLNVPMGGPDNWVQFKAGKMWTLMGYEVIDDVLDPNLSVGNQFTYLENFTNVGVGADFKLGPSFDAQLRLINGWDVVQDNNTSKSLMARVGWTPSPAFTLGVLGYWGPEGTDNTELTRQGVDVVATFKGLSKTTLVAQFDYGTDEALGVGGDDATWWGVGGWIIRDLGSTTQLALRGDYIDDKDGVRTSNVFGFPVAPSRQFGSFAATLNWRVLSKVLIRPEFRFDFSSEDDYGDFDESDNFSFGMGASYQF